MSLSTLFRQSLVIFLKSNQLYMFTDYHVEKCTLVILRLSVQCFPFGVELSQPSAEYLACQVELRRVEHSKKLVLDEFESHKQMLEKQLQSEVNYYF